MAIGLSPENNPTSPFSSLPVPDSTGPLHHSTKSRFRVALPRNNCVKPPRYLFALIYFYRLIRLDYDRRTAARAVLYLCVFPTTLFLSAVYSESLFLALVISAFYYARSDRWLFAGALTAVAALCRPPGVLLTILSRSNTYLRRNFDGIESSRLLRATSGPTSSRGSSHSPAMAGSAAGTSYQKRKLWPVWNRRLTLPWNTLLYSLQHIGSSIGYHGALNLFFTAILIALAIFACFRLRPVTPFIRSSRYCLSRHGEILNPRRGSARYLSDHDILALLGEHKAFNRTYLALSAI